MIEPVVSIIMGTYNPDIPQLMSAVDSIIKQSLKSWELLIVDDGSTENISEIIRISKLDERIIYLREDSNAGLAHALNRTIKKAKGKYIARMDDDDISLPDRLKAEVDFLESHSEYDWVGCVADLFDNNGIWGKASRPQIPTSYSFLHSSPFIHPSVMFRRNVLISYGGYNESNIASRCEDYELFMRLYALGKRGYNIQNSYFQYREDECRLQRRMIYCCNEMLIRIHGFNSLKILSWKTVPYILKPLMVGIASFFPVFSQKIRTSGSTGDHKIERSNKRSKATNVL